MKKTIKYIVLIILLVGLYTQNVFGFVRRVDNIDFEYDRLDILAIGNSNLYSGLSPQQLYKQYNYKSLLLARANQTVDETYQLLCSVIDVKKPKYVLWDIDNLFSHYNPNVFKALDNSNKRIKDLKCIADKPEYLNQYGYMISETMLPSIIKQNQTKCQLTDSTLQYFDSVVKTCQQNNIQLILTAIPNLDSWSLDKYQKVRQLSNQYTLDYWDMNKDKSVGINWMTDTRDGGIHLNNNGAYKVTAILGQYFQRLSDES